MTGFMMKDQNEFANGLKTFYNNVIEWNAIAGKTRDNKEVLIPLYENLVKEELGEMKVEYLANNTEKFLKELCDVMVVGSFLFYVVHGEELLKSVNVTPCLRMMLKPDELFFDNSYNVISMMNCVELICANVDCDIIGALHAVQRSNFSKFPSISSVDPEKECKWIESHGRYTGVTYKQVYSEGVNRYVFTDSKGKIMKPSVYFDPDMSVYIN